MNFIPPYAEKLLELASTGQFPVPVNCEIHVGSEDWQSCANSKVFGEMVGIEGRHYPDTDTLEIDQPRIRIFGVEGRVTTAVAARGLINADGSEAQLFDKAVVVREASTNAQGVVTPRSEMHSDFLHMFANTEQVRSHLPVLLVRGAGDRFTSQDGIDFDNLDRVMQLTGRVRGTLLPPKDKDKK